MLPVWPLRSTGRFEQLNKITGWVHQQDLRSSRTGHEVIAEPHSGIAQAGNLGWQILNNKVDAVPTAWSWLFAVLHGSTRRACGPAEQEPQRATDDVRKGWSVVGQK